MARKIAELMGQGYYCSQTIVAFGLENQGKINWDLMRAMEGLKGGLGCWGGICGALTGAVCLLGLYAGRGPVDEKPNARLDPMLQQLVGWFHTTMGERHGGVHCETITEKYGYSDLPNVCPTIVGDTYVETTKILESYGFHI